MDLFYVLLILLVATRAFGEVAARVRQPALVGEILAGITFGAIVAKYPETFPDLVDLSDNEVFVSLTDLGMFFLMLFAGVEMQPHKILRHSGGAMAAALGGMVVPLALGIALGWYFLPASNLKVAQCLFIGTALAITAVPATVRILVDLGRLDTTVGQTIVTAAVFDDILSLLLLAWLTGLITMAGPLGPSALAILLGKVGLFFVLTGVTGFYLFPTIGRFIKRLLVQEHEISALLVAALAFAVLAEVLGLHFIVGSFVAGLFFGRKTLDDAAYERVRNAISAMTFGFLAPIFFASIGMHLNFSALTGAPAFVAIMIVAAFFGKVVGAGGSALAYGFSRRESAAIGFGMSPRGAVELVIAGIALKAGLFHLPNVDSPIVDNLFSAVVIMAVVTTVVSPIILQRIFADPPD